MRTVRKRKIARVIKRHAIIIMNQHFNNEHALAVAGVSVISDERAWEISDTLSHYAQILYRNFSEDSDIYKNEWVKNLIDFY